MKFFNICVFIYVFLLSCKEEPNQIKTYYKIYNESEYKLALSMYKPNLKVDSLRLGVNESKEYSTTSCRGCNTYEPLILGDSVIVSYNDSISIIHGSKLYDVKKIY